MHPLRKLNILFQGEARGIDDVLSAKIAPPSVQSFLESTFTMIRDGKVHEIASSFAYGRENLVPVMFSRILDACQVSFKTSSSLPLLSRKARSFRWGTAWPYGGPVGFMF